MSSEKEFFPGMESDDEMNLGGQANEDENMVLDLGDVDENRPDFEPVPPAVYDCEIDNCEYRRSKAGNPMLSWQFSIITGEFTNRKLFTQTVLNKESGRKNLKRMLVRLFPDVDVNKFNIQQFLDAGLAIGRQCRVKVKIGKDQQGNRNNQVVEVLAPGETSDFLR